ncbi:O-antigen ligase family protein [Pedococcus bigeumensis]|uniref:O-antigen ligase family protein n=1 Tax=Pedococcus bigeumensis TaxID=433644 RepID=UPI00112AE1DE|nr:O-antigen ligase family protein [Pedococcus bigeumensis]
MALIPFGGTVVEVQGRGLIIPYFALPMILLTANLMMRALIPHLPQYPMLRRNIAMSAVLVFLLFVAQTPHGLGGVSGYAFAMFVVGTVGGISVGTVWAVSSRRVGWVDLGATFCLVVTVVQLATRFAAAGSPSGFHRAAVLSWGGSNFIAGVTVVLSLTLASRIRELGYRAVLLAVPIAGIGVAALTFSRGALIAAAAGLLVLMWNVGNTSVGRSFLRTVGVIAVAAAFPIMQFIIATRSAGGYDPSQNLSIRYVLFKYAWQDFVSSPLIGTGWLALRDAGLFTVEVSYAHNVILSFLQIAGACGAVYIVVLLRDSYRGLRRSPLTGGAIVAALAISMSDPFFEGGVGALVAWAAIAYALARPLPADADHPTQDVP